MYAVHWPWTASLCMREVAFVRHPVCLYLCASAASDSCMACTHPVRGMQQVARQPLLTLAGVANLLRSAPTCTNGTKKIITNFTQRSCKPASTSGAAAARSPPGCVGMESLPPGEQDCELWGSVATPGIGPLCSKIGGNSSHNRASLGVPLFDPNSQPQTHSRASPRQAGLELPAWPGRYGARARLGRPVPEPPRSFFCWSAAQIHSWANLGGRGPRNYAPE